MLFGWLLLLASLFAGEVLGSALGLPLPGPVLGMALLALLLGARRSLLPRAEGTANALLEMMPLLFVPAGVGVMQHLAELREAWLPVVVTLLLGTVLTLLATGLTYRFCQSRVARHDP